MRLLLALASIAISMLCACAKSPNAASESAALSGEKALEHVRAQVAFGPRPPGSPQLEKCREYLTQQLREFGYQIEDDTFVAETPYGSIRMHNLIARKRDSGGKVVVLASHYDTKLMEGQQFVGANDAGSSTGLLLELARVLAREDSPLDYWFVFFDGEEAFVEWSTFDSTYGSRHLARRWKDEGVAPRIRALILLDMIGDKDLDIFYETNSTPWLMDLVWKTAAKIGLQSILSRIRTPVEDDHIPFLAAGIPSVDIIDLNYGPSNSYFHTPADTLDKISPQSMEKTGRLVLAVLQALQKRL
jgi:Zn-dependent M28 family amino/carboxypeptidase